jgi:hypothetical protein
MPSITDEQDNSENIFDAPKKSIDREEQKPNTDIN